MRVEVSIPCPLCKMIVSVVDKTIAEHNDCPAGGMTYVPSPFRSGSPSGPKIEILAKKPIKCSGCGISGTLALCKVTRPDPTMN